MMNFSAFVLIAGDFKREGGSEEVHQLTEKSEDFPVQLRNLSFGLEL